jgi:glycosyltransferase involved in cell wall biosynthesis
VTIVGTPRRILHLVHYSAKTPFIVEFVREIDKTKWFPTVVSVEPPGALQAELESVGVPCGSLHAAAPHDYVAAVARLRRLLRASKSDVLHGHLFDANLIGAIASRLPASSKFVVTRHEPPAFLKFSRVHPLKQVAVRALERFIFDSADVIVAPSERTASELRGLGASGKKIRKIPLAIDLPKVSAVSAAEVASVRSVLGVSRSLSAVVVSRLAPEKNLETLLRAWRRLCDQKPGSRLFVVGEGPERRRLSEIVAQLALTDNVQFLGTRRDVSALMMAADMVIHVSWTESTGMVLLEALALQRPLITTAVGIVGEYALDGEHCLVVGPRDEGAIVRLILRLSADPELGKRLGANGRRLVEAVFSMPAMTREYEALWSGLVAPR